MAEVRRPAESDSGGPTDTESILAERQIDTRGRNLRQHAAHGTIINSAFQVGLAGVGLLRRVVVAAFLTQADFGIWGILVTTLITLTWLKQVGIADKYIQQTEPDQEAAFRKAFTLELVISLIFFVVVAGLLPLYALAYDQSELILPGIVLAAAVPISAFQAPIWIAYRRMQFVRQRILSSIDPILALAVTVIFGVAGLGYWALVIGALAGSLAGGVIAVITSPYSLRLRFDRASVKEYAQFSWPLVGLGLSNMVAVQGTLLVASHKVGLAGVGSIALATSIASFADRVDGIINQAIYPAVCAVVGRVELLFETFVKSNRVVLMWAIPFGAGIALFAGDLVSYVLGERWRDATSLLAAVGVILGVAQIAFNWSIYMRAVNDTKPLFKASLVNLATFAIVMVPAILTLGLTGYVVGLAVSMAVQIAVRGYFLRKLFTDFQIVRHMVRGIGPSLPAVGLILLIRVVADGDRTLAIALGEVVLYILATAAFVMLFERTLVKELAGYLRGSNRTGLRRATSHA